MEATQACEEPNALQNDDMTRVQALFLLDTGKKTHFTGYGDMYNHFLQKQEIGHFTGKGRQPVPSTDPKSKNCLLQLEVYSGVKRKRKSNE